MSRAKCIQRTKQSTVEKLAIPRMLVFWWPRTQGDRSEVKAVVLFSSAILARIILLVLHCLKLAFDVLCSFLPIRRFLKDIGSLVVIRSFYLPAHNGNESTSS